jgi:triosephosphate isomerase (TIM)
MKKLIVANWKMNPDSAQAAKQLFADMGKLKASKSEIVICPPFPYLHLAKPKNYALGAQDIFWESKGAFTGEVAAPMLQSLGVQYVIIGHSERRKWVGETDEVVNRKVKAALAAGLKVILCVGEDAEVRDKGMTAAKRFVDKELREGLADLKNPSLIVAYEPIWAIGSGRADNPTDTVEMAEFIRSRVSGARVLYGGSVNSGNAKDFLQHPEIDGALVGGASLRAYEFKGIITTVE